VSTLYNEMMSQQNPNVETVKKVHQIDSEKLEAAYLEMFNRFSKSVLKSKFVIEYNWKNLMDSFDQNLLVKPVRPHVSLAVYDNKAELPDLPVRTQTL
jgi:hypothetical protein